MFVVLVRPHRPCRFLLCAHRDGASSTKLLFHAPPVSTLQDPSEVGFQDEIKCFQDYSKVLCFSFPALTIDEWLTEPTGSIS